MKALTLHQPWASLLVAGLKGPETRSWGTTYRGDLLIHASATAPDPDVLEAYPFTQYLPDLGPLPLGAVVGRITVTGIITTTEWKRQHPDYLIRHEYYFGDYSDGRFAWLNDNQVRFDQPVPARGFQRIWNFRQCRECGCSEFDACMHPTAGNCTWVDADLCSHCVTVPGQSHRQYDAFTIPNRLVSIH